MSSNGSLQNTDIEQSVQQNLDASIENLDPAIRRRLNQARIAALESKNQPKISWRLATAVSFALMVAFSWNFMPQQLAEPEALLTDVLQEDLEMLDDLEFIVWMSEEDDNVSS